MTTVNRDHMFSDVLSAGEALTVTPAAGASAIVRLFARDGTSLQEVLTAEDMYGPYLFDVRYEITALSGSVELTEGLFEPLYPLSSLGERWDDLRFPAQGINPAGAVDAPTVDNVLSSFPGTLLFSGSQDNVIAGVAQMPHTWKRGSAIVPHIHWAKTTTSANAVSWRLYTRMIGNPTDAPGAWSSALSPVATIGDHTAANLQQLLTYWADTAIDLSDKKESAMFSWRLDRLGSSDAYNDAARLYELDFHYVNDKRGTVTAIPT